MPDRDAVLLICELRIMRQGHPIIVSSHKRWRKIQEVHPALAEAGRFID
jgi:hypothetical protein